MKKNKYLKRILKKMCSYVNADYNKIDFKKPNWFLEYSWTLEQEYLFRKWLIRYLKRNKRARYSLMNVPTKDKFVLTKFVKEFVFNYGWKYKNK